MKIDKYTPDPVLVDKLHEFGKPLAGNYEKFTKYLLKEIEIELIDGSNPDNQKRV